MPDGGGELTGPSSYAQSLCSAVCPASAACMLLPESWQAGLPRSRAGTVSASSPAGPFTISKIGGECFEQRLVILLSPAGALCSTKINKPKEGWAGGQINQTGTLFSHLGLWDLYLRCESCSPDSRLHLSGQEIYQYLSTYPFPVRCYALP